MRSALEREKHHEPVRHKGLLIAGTSITTAIVVVGMAALALLPSERLHADTPSLSSNAVVEQVSPKQINEVCPSRMQLADTERYGDSEFQATAGNLSSSERFAALGSIFHAQIRTLDDADGMDATVLDGALNQNNTQSVFSLAQDNANTAVVFDTRLLQAQEGTGTASSITSWASDGDLQGMAATTCIPTALEQQFILPSTQTGTTQQLIISNPADKATTVRISARKADGTSISLSTNSTIAIPANSETTLMLSAALPNENTAYLTVSSDNTQISTIIRAISMDGLTPAGNDYIMPLQEAGTEQAIMLGEIHGTTTLYAHATEQATLQISWLSEHGLIEHSTTQLDTNTTSIITLDDIPKNALGVYVQSDTPVSLMSRVQQEGTQGQQDYAYVQAASGYEQSALTIAPHTTAHITIANMEAQAASVEITGYNANNTATKHTSLTIDANSATTVSADDLGDDTVTIYVEPHNTNVVWGAWLSQSSLEKANIAAVAYTPASPLTIHKQTITAIHNQQIVQ